MSNSIIPSAVIAIERPWRWLWGARKFKVLIDGTPYGLVKPGETKEFYVEPGVHTVSIHIDLTKTTPLNVVADESRPCVIHCVPTGFWTFLITPRIWFKPSEHLQVTLR